MGFAGVSIICVMMKVHREPGRIIDYLWNVGITPEMYEQPVEMMLSRIEVVKSERSNLFSNRIKYRWPKIKLLRS